MHDWLGIIVNGRNFNDRVCAVVGFNGFSKEAGSNKMSDLMDFLRRPVAIKCRIY